MSISLYHACMNLYVEIYVCLYVYMCVHVYDYVCDICICVYAHI